MNPAPAPTQPPAQALAEQVALAFVQVQNGMKAWCDERPTSERRAALSEVYWPLNKLFARFKVLLAMSMAGMLPGRRRYLGRVVTPRATLPARKQVLVPLVRGWLGKLMSWHVANLGAYVAEHLMRAPEVETLIGGSAEARRILRSFYWAAGRKLPESLREKRAPRPRRARTAAATPAPPPPPPPPPAPPEEGSRYWNTGRPFGYLHVDTSRTDTPGWPPPFRTT